MNHFFRLLFLASTVLFAVSCAKRPTSENLEKLDRKKTSRLIATLDSLTTQRPDFFYTKISTQYKDTNRQISFKTSIRMIRDSAINALITYAKFPIFNTLITQDSLTVVDKRERCYLVQNLGYIKENFGIEFSYRNLEELILGLPLDYDINQKYFQIHDPYEYIISSHRKFKIKRYEKKEKEDIIVKYYLNNEADHLKAMHVESPSDSTFIQVDYKSRKKVDNYTIPEEVRISIITPKNRVFIEMAYEKVEINEPQPLYLIIPESYERCK
jgi:hypothetical protein